MKTELTIIDPKEFGIEETKATELTSGLTTILEERVVLIDSYKNVISLEVTPENLGVFKELRLQIRDNRTKGIEKWHKTNKEFFLTGGRFVDAIKNKEVAENERMEENLLKAEKHFENLEDKRLLKLKSERWEKIKIYTEFEPQGLAEMSDEVFEAFESGLKSRHEAKLLAEKEAEQKRIAEQKAEAQRLEAQLLENERLKRDAEIKEKERQAEAKKQADILAKQKAESDKKLKAEKEAREKIEAELELKRQAEAKKQADILAKQKAESDKKLKAEKEAREKIEAELELKRQAEAKIKADQIAKEKADELERKKIAKAPIKTKLILSVNSLILDLPDSEISADIQIKFDGLKKS